MFRSGGFCLVTDVDGDTVNLLWEPTNTPGPATEILTKGTYLCGTGKYAGIRGHYTFACRESGAQSVCQITGQLHDSIETSLASTHRTTRGTA